MAELIPKKLGTNHQVVRRILSQVRIMRGKINEKRQVAVTKPTVFKDLIQRSFRLTKPLDE